jgi:hypothetical protein
MYIATRKIKVEREGEMVELMPGDPVPEADTWRPSAVRAAISVQQIKEVPDPSPSPGRGRESHAPAPPIRVR